MIFYMINDMSWVKKLREANPEFPLGKTTDKLDQKTHIFANSCSKGSSSGIPTFPASLELRNPGAYGKQMRAACCSSIQACSESGL